MATLDGFVYAVGGYDGTTRIDTVERYSPRTNSWEFVRSLPIAISRCHATAFNGRLYVAGQSNVFVSVQWTCCFAVVAILGCVYT